MIIVDHLFIFLLFLVQPVYGAHTYRQYLQRVKAGKSPDRLSMYRHTAFIQWLALAVLILTWHWLDRPYSALGLVPAGGQGFYAALALVVSFSGFLVYYWKQAKAMSTKDKSRQEQGLGALVHILPRTPGQLRGFIKLSFTAGIVEEIVYRGFVIWYLALVMPLWAAVVVSSILFGLGHSYQGPGGALKTGLVGLAFGGLYVLSGSIWLPIIGHALLDVLQGLMVFEVLRADTQSEASTAAS